MSPTPQERPHDATVEIELRVLHRMSDAVLVEDRAGMQAWLPSVYVGNAPGLGFGLATLPRWLAEEKHLSASKPDDRQGVLL